MNVSALVPTDIRPAQELSPKLVTNTGLTALTSENYPAPSTASYVTAGKITENPQFVDKIPLQYRVRHGYVDQDEDTSYEIIPGPIRITIDPLEPVVSAAQRTIDAISTDVCRTILQAVPGRTKLNSAAASCGRLFSWPKLGMHWETEVGPV